jgi:hypothetical protein
MTNENKTMTYPTFEELELRDLILSFSVTDKNGNDIPSFIRCGVGSKEYFLKRMDERRAEYDKWPTFCVPNGTMEMLEISLDVPLNVYTLDEWKNVPHDGHVQITKGNVGPSNTRWRRQR